MAGYQVIARKYRPRTFDEVVGQEAVARTLRNAIDSDRVAHAYMFCGPRGVGKTSMARILAKALNCLRHEAPTPEPCGECEVCVAAATGDDLDVFEMDAASNRKVDDARNLIANVAFQPARARFKVYIVDEVHMLTTEAFNALLKTLEEPPGHVKFVFATTDPQKVPATILSRCQRFDFRPVPAPDIAKLLRRICEREGVEADEAALVAVARAASGGVRDAESLLEQLTTLGRGVITLEDLHALLGTVSGERMRALFDAVAGGDVAMALEVAGEVLDAGTDPGELLRQCMRHAHDLLLVKVQGPNAAGVVADEHARRSLADQAGRLSDATLAYSVTLFSEALRNSRQIGEGRLFAEAALARLAGHRDMRYLDQIARDLAQLEKRLGAEPGGAASAQARAPRSPSPAGGGGPRGGRPGSGPSGSGPSGGGPGGTGHDGSARGESGGEATRPEPSPTSPPAAVSRGGEPGPGGAHAASGSGGVALAEAPATTGTARSDTATSGTARSQPVPAPRPARAAAVGESPPVALAATRPLPDAPSTPQRPDMSVTLQADDDVPLDAYAGAAAASEAMDDDIRDEATGARDPLDVGAVRARWNDIREVARQGSSRLMAHLQPALVEALDGDTVVLSFPRSNSFHRDGLAAQDLADGLRAALAEVLGCRLRFRTTDRDDDPEVDSDEKASARRRNLLDDRLSAAEVATAREAPLSQLLLKELGAKIVQMERDR